MGYLSYEEDAINVWPDDDDRLMFADPGGESSLYAAGPGNPRNQACPDCGRPDVLTVLDAREGKCCNRCAREKEQGW